MDERADRRYGIRVRNAGHGRFTLDRLRFGSMSMIA